MILFAKGVQSCRKAGFEIEILCVISNAPEQGWSNLGAEMPHLSFVTLAHKHKIYTLDIQHIWALQWQFRHPSLIQSLDMKNRTFTQAKTLTRLWVPNQNVYFRSGQFIVQISTKSSFCQDICIFIPNLGGIPPQALSYPSSSPSPSSSFTMNPITSIICRRFPTPKMLRPNFSPPKMYVPSGHKTSTINVNPWSPWSHNIRSLLQVLITGH